MKRRPMFELFLFCILIGIGIVYLRLFSNYPKPMTDILKGFWMLSMHYVEMLGNTSLYNALSSLSGHQLLFIAVLAQIIAGGFILACFKGSFEKGVKIIAVTPFRVIRWGLIIYILYILSVGVLLFSVAGFPAAVIMGAAFFVMTFLGAIPFSIFIGNHIAMVLRLNVNTFIKYLLGDFIFAVCTSVTVLAGAVCLFILPVISMGTLFCYALDKYIYKGCVSDSDENKPNMFDRDKIRDIITKDMDLTDID